MLFTAVERLEWVIEQQEQDPDLIKEARPLHQDWYRRCEALAELPERMRRLADNPTPQQTANGLKIVTHEHVIAELFSGAAYSIRLVEAFERSLEVCDPRLFDVIQYI
jgi:hypothetical protein